MLMFRILAAAVLPMIAAAQTSKQTFPVIYSQSDQDVNEIFTAVRTIADVRGTLDARQFTVEGTTDQLRTAEWVLRQLDQPAGAPSASSVLAGIEDRYMEDTARVFYLPKTLSPQEFNEIQTCVRTITDIRRVYPYVSRRAIVLRASEEAVQAAEWLIEELTRPDPTGKLVYPREPGKQADNHTRVFRLAPGKDVQNFQETQTLLRVLTDTRRVYPYAPKRFIASRGTREQNELAAWILEQLSKDLPLSQQASSPEFTTQSSEVVRVFYLPAGMTTENFIEAVKKVRGAVDLPKMGVVAADRVFAARGTAAQIAEIETLLKQ